MSAQIITFPVPLKQRYITASEKIRQKVEKIRERRGQVANEYFSGESEVFGQMPDNIIKFPSNFENHDQVIAELKDLFYQRNLELRDMVLRIRNASDQKRTRFPK